MYYVCKRLEISSAHALHLSYESKCESLHGHNWIVKIYCKSETLNADGMVTDFTHIKKDITSALDLRPRRQRLQGGGVGEQDEQGRLRA